MFLVINEVWNGHNCIIKRFWEYYVHDKPYPYLFGLVLDTFPLPRSHTTFFYFLFIILFDIIHLFYFIYDFILYYTFILFFIYWKNTVKCSDSFLVQLYFISFMVILVQLVFDDVILIFFFHAFVHTNVLVLEHSFSEPHFDDY